MRRALKRHVPVSYTHLDVYKRQVCNNRKRKKCMDLTKQFFKYVSQNIFGLLGTSCYIDVYKRQAPCRLAQAQRLL